MTQEEKELLLKDLCARFPFGIVLNVGDMDIKLDRQHQGIGILYPEDCSDEFNLRNNNANFYITISGCYYGEDIKPYLRPMSSMTDEEREEFRAVGGVMSYSPQHDTWAISAFAPEAYDWLNKNKFDYRGLIPMGLALEAPEGMYKDYEYEKIL